MFLHTYSHIFHHCSNIYSGSVKERMAKHDEKILDTVCRFAVSFFQEAVERQKEKTQNSLDSDGEEEEVELPPFLHRLFEWLLDHHNVEGSQARLRICLMVNRLLRLLGENAAIDEDLAQVCLALFFALQSQR